MQIKAWIILWEISKNRFIDEKFFNFSNTRMIIE